ncbi:MAG: response regulator [Planctomycetes bacterium]|nr:response regulator [Planctomycetota bacterium]
MAELIQGIESDFFPFQKEHDTYINSSNAWKILVVDDDRDIHALTSIVLKDLTFDERPLQLHFVFSGEEACDFIDQNPDCSLVLLDLMMEKSNSGILVANHIREIAKNQQVRIILRTGVSNTPTVSALMQKYDINDVKVKTELTADKFKSSILRALQQFSELDELQRVTQNGAFGAVEDALDPLRGCVEALQRTKLSPAQKKLVQKLNEISLKLLKSTSPEIPQAQ